MADDAVSPGLPTSAGQVPPSEVAIRPGSPGTASDTVSSSRVRPQKRVEKPVEVKDPWREIVETIVFVIVLVFMLKTFLAEAFVIPTGSMATTLLGYHRDVLCKQCGYEYRVNCSTEVEPPDPRFKEDVESTDCPNCAYRNTIRGPFAGGR